MNYLELNKKDVEHIEHDINRIEHKKLELFRQSLDCTIEMLHEQQIMLEKH